MGYDKTKSLCSDEQSDFSYVILILLTLIQSFDIINQPLNKNRFGNMYVCDKKEILIRPSGMVPAWTFLQNNNSLGTKQ